MKKPRKKRTKKTWPKGKGQAIYAYVSKNIHAFVKRQGKMSAYIEKLIKADIKRRKK